MYKVVIWRISVHWYSSLKGYDKQWIFGIYYESMTGPFFHLGGTAWAYWSRRARELIRAQSVDAAGVAPGERVGEAVGEGGETTPRESAASHQH